MSWKSVFQFLKLSGKSIKKKIMALNLLPRLEARNKSTFTSRFLIQKSKKKMKYKNFKPRKMIKMLDSLTLRSSKMINSLKSLVRWLQLSETETKETKNLTLTLSTLLRKMIKRINSWLCSKSKLFKKKRPTIHHQKQKSLHLSWLKFPRKRAKSLLDWA
jgi:hypothetical protein